MTSGRRRDGGLPPDDREDENESEETLDELDFSWWTKQLGHEPRRLDADLHRRAAMAEPSEEARLAGVSPSAALLDALDRCDVQIAEWAASMTAITGGARVSEPRGIT
jgi:hypothetical protein